MDITSATITFVTAAYSLYNTIKTIKGLPKEFDETEIRLPLALNTLDEFKKHLSWDIDSDRKAAIEKYLKPCDKSAKQLESIFKSIKRHEGKDGLSRYRIVVLKMGKASRVEVLLRQIIESLHLLALNNEAHMATSIAQLTDSIEALNKVESSIPDEDFDEIQATNFTQHISEGGTGYQNSNRVAGNQYLTHGGGNYQSDGGAITINHHAGITMRERQNKVLGSLDKVAYRAAKDRNRRPVPRTCKWVVQHKVFLDWKDKPSSGLLWLSADPGCGKSVLARHLVDSVLADRRCCYFFFKDGYTGQTTADSALSCLLHQLLVAHNEVFSDQILSRFEQSSQVYNSTPDLWDILKTVVRAIGSEVICVFDAFDECSSEDARTLAAMLRNYYEQPINLKFLVTSRPYDDMKYNFRINKNISIIQINGETEDEVQKIINEIDIFMEWEINEMQVAGYISPDEAISLQKWLHEVPNRSYLWAYLVLAEIKDRPGARIELVLSDLPKTVKESYEAILTRTSRRHKRQTVAELLHIILAATRPLSVVEMYAAITVQPTYTSISQVGTPRDNYETHIRDVCGLFVYIVDFRVYLFHQTAREFLVARRLTEGTVEADEQPLGHNRESKKSNEPWEHSFQTTTSHHTLYEKCARYLALIEAAPFSEDYSKEYPFYAYCVEQWTLHYRLSDTKDIDLGLSLLQFSDNPKTPTLPGRWCVDYFRLRQSILLDDSFKPLMVASYFGLEAIANHIIKLNSSAVFNLHIRTQRSALSFAAENGHTAIVKALIHGRPWSFQRIKNRKRQYANNVCSEGKTSLIYAASNGHNDTVKLLINFGVNPDLCDDFGESALSYALVYGHNSVADMLAGSVPALEVDAIKERLLFYACRHGRADILEKLIKSSVNMNVGGNEDESHTPLQLMIIEKHYGMALSSLNNGAEPDYPDINGNTPFLQCLVFSNVLESMPVWQTILEKLPAASFDKPLELLSKRVDSAVEDTVLGRAAWALTLVGHHEVAKRLLFSSQCLFPTVLLIREYCRQEDLFSDAVLEWIAKLDKRARAEAFSLFKTQLLKTEIKALVNPDILEERDEDGRTALFHAAIEGDVDLLKILIDAGGDVNVVNHHFETPLLCSALLSRLDCVWVLLHNGADREARNQHGLTSILATVNLACRQRGHSYINMKAKLATVRYLGRYGADLEARDNESRSSLEYAVTAPYEELATCLLEAGADANAPFSDGRTPLECLDDINWGEINDAMRETFREILRRYGAR